MSDTPFESRGLVAESAAATDAAQAAERAFLRAVQAEWAAIERHRSAADLHHDRADRLLSLVDDATSDQRRRELRDRAAIETERADAALRRAATAKARLQAEGAAEADEAD